MCSFVVRMWFVSPSSPHFPKLVAHHSASPNYEVIAVAMVYALLVAKRYLVQYKETSKAEQGVVKSDR